MFVSERWYLRRKIAEPFPIQAAELSLEPILAKVLHARRIDTPERVRAFLLEEDISVDPFQMAGMSQAVTRIRRALAHGEHIVVYGDFDTDGVSATALLVSALKLLGGHVRGFIPDRFEEGYGLNIAVLEGLRREGAQLVVTVDCGVRSIKEVARARELGLDIIITDHHAPAQELPAALAVVDPKRPDCPYPFKELAGVGVAYRLAEALFRVAARMGRGAQAEREPEQFLDLVALGTVSDIVPLIGENRQLVRQGLKRLKESPRVGVRALMEIAGVRPEEVDSEAIAFRLGPRLNAAGRLKNAQLAYNLLMSDAQEITQELASQLNTLNQERQRLLEIQVLEAKELLGNIDERLLLIVGAPTFHEGIVGLVASRLTEEFHKPSLVMCHGEMTTRGSARSIEGFHITQALDACGELLLQHGGHARAAGFTLPNENLPAFYERLEQYGAEHLNEEMLSRRRLVDALVSLDELTLETPPALALLEPFGEGNPEPALATLGLRLLDVRPVGQEGKHLRLEVSDGKQSVQAIAFRQGYLVNELKPGDMVDLIYRPTLNEWQGQVSLQLVIQSIRPSAAGTEALSKG